MIVVNKADLLSPAELATLTRTLKSDSRDGVQVIAATMGALPVDVLLGQYAAAETSLDARHEVHHHHHDDEDDHGHDHAHDHGHDEFESFVLTLPELTDPVAFSARVVDTIKAHDILRLKGFAAVAGKPMRLTLQAVGPRIETYFDRPLGLDEPRQTRLVVIGQAGLNRAAIEKALA